MARYFLAYWKPSEVDRHKGPFDHAAGNQYRRVDIGDTVWLVTISDGELLLVGKLIVGEITDWEGATKRRGTTDLWEAEYHVIAETETTQPLRSVSLTDIVGQLRFESSTGKNRLAIHDGRVPAQQLQTMRKLTPESNEILEEIWAKSNRRN